MLTNVDKHENTEGSHINTAQDVVIQSFGKNNKLID